MGPGFLNQVSYITLPQLEQLLACMHSAEGAFRNQECAWGDKKTFAFHDTTNGLFGSRIYQSSRSDNPNQPKTMCHAGEGVSGYVAQGTTEPHTQAMPACQVFVSRKLHPKP